MASPRSSGFIPGVRAIILVLFTVAVGACDPERSPSGPTGEVATFTAQLLPANVPGLVVGTEANGTATATVSVAISRGSGGAIASALADVTVALIGYPSSTVISSAQLRRGEPGESGTVVQDFGVAPGSVLIAGGAGSIGATGLPLPSPTVQDMLNGAAHFFIVLTTTANPNGVARGQLLRQ